jgi:hypothetical protein
MKKSKFTESQITKALKEYEARRDVQDLCRELGINKATFYNIGVIKGKATGTSVIDPNAIHKSFQTISS